MLRESKKPNLYAELFHRHTNNPILTAQDWPYPANTVFNAGACQMGDETILLVRVEDRRGHSHLTVARSNDGVSNWHIDSKPSFAPDPENFTDLPSRFSARHPCEDLGLARGENRGFGSRRPRRCARVRLWRPQCHQ